jgi:short subunit dehydrogenase-like uncharacterized protein
MTLAVLGATGFTGRLVVEEARRAGLPLRLVGRRRDALEALAEAGEEARVADARDIPALSRALDGCDVVLSCAGPFMPLGLAPVLASIGVGAHYLDTSGEQVWVRRLHDLELDVETVLIPAFGFDYVPGDLAARLAAGQVDGPLDEVLVGYSVRGVGTSRGTRRTIATVMGQKQVTYVNGRLVPSRFGERTRTMRFPFGDKTVVEWSGTEPLTVPRHTEVRTVHSFLRAPAAASLGGRLGPLVAPLLRPLSRLGPAGPSEQSRARSRFAVVAEASGPGGTGRAVLTGRDVYGLTALLLVRGTQALIAGEAHGKGVLAPAEAFDARSLAARLAPLLEIAEPD